jgi:hypothetical protein
MKRIMLVLSAALLALGATTYGTLAAQGGNGGNDDRVWAAITKARAATAKYHDVSRAVHDGYRLDSPCVEAPDSSGAMGIHYLNATYAADPAIIAAKPELLLYFPQANGKLQLIAVEYFRPDADQNLATTDDRPSLAGIPFDGPMEGHNPTMPRHYDLHAWIWDWNPAGVFAQFNPKLHC